MFAHSLFQHTQHSARHHQAPARLQGERRRRLRVAGAAALLLRCGAARLLRAHDHDGAGVRVRVPGQLGPPRHHAAHRPLLPHAHGRPQAELGRRARGPRRHRQDGDLQGPGQGGRQAVRGLQLLGRPRLPGHGQVLQGPRAVGRLGLLRRVQSHRARGGPRKKRRFAFFYCC